MSAPATLIHFGLVLVALVFFVLGLARLAAAVSAWRLPQEEVPGQRWSLLVVGLAVIAGALIFMIICGADTRCLQVREEAPPPFSDLMPLKENSSVCRRP